MKVSKVIFRPQKIEKMPKLLGFADVTFDGVFVVRNIKLLEGQYGAFIGMPSEPRNDEGKYPDICYPVTKAFRQEIQDAVLEEAGFGDGVPPAPKEEDPLADDTVDTSAEDDELF